MIERDRVSAAVLLKRLAVYSLTESHLAGRRLRYGEGVLSHRVTHRQLVVSQAEGRESFEEQTVALILNRF
jgi:hypothetical protein